MPPSRLTKNMQRIQLCLARVFLEAEQQVGGILGRAGGQVLLAGAKFGLGRSTPTEASLSPHPTFSLHDGRHSLLCRLLGITSMPFIWTRAEYVEMAVSASCMTL